MTPLEILLVLVVGTVAGFINVVAGGGSLLTLPTLIFLGLPPTVANGTNRVAILGQNIVAAAKFREEGFHDLGLGLKLSIAAVFGSLLGARLAVVIPEHLFKQILAGVMLLVVVAIVAKRLKPSPVSESGGTATDAASQPPQASAPAEPAVGTDAGTGPEESKARTGPTAERLRWPLLQGVFMFVIGIYGGFVQAGVGYLVIVALSTLGGLSLVRTNSLKVVVVGAFTVPALVVFVLSDKVVWAPALVLTVGNGVGGWLGTTFSIKKGDKWIQAVLVVAVLAMAGKLLGLYG